MPLTPESDAGVSTASRSRRRARQMIIVVAAVVLGAGAVVIADRNPDTTTVPIEDSASEAHDDPGTALLRTGDGVRDGDGGGGVSSVDDAATSVTQPVPATIASVAPGGPPGRHAADDPESGGGAESGSAAGPRPLGSPEAAPTPVGTVLPPPLYLPGDGDAPVLGPVPTGGDDEDDDDRDAPAPDDPTPSDPEPELIPYVAEAPDPDEVGCPKFNLYPLGGFAEGAPAMFATLSPRFRELAPIEWSKPTLVCGHALEPWRDLVVQRLVSGGTPDGALITAADGSSMVLRVSEIEWTAYRFRYGGGPIGPNLVGYPTGRMTWAGVGVVQTTAGGLVFEHPEAMGVPLLGGAWDLWVSSGGPTGPMGLPTGLPESAMGPIGAEEWVAGIPSTGARQEFSSGWLFLPGVLTDVEAAAQPADRYQWHDAGELDPVPTEPFDYRGHIMQISGISFYVDQEGIRHWIRTQSQWSCASWNLMAAEYAVRGVELARYPLGSEFVCTDYPSKRRSTGGK